MIGRSVRLTVFDRQGGLVGCLTRMSERCYSDYNSAIRECNGVDGALGSSQRLLRLCNMLQLNQASP